MQPSIRKKSAHQIRDVMITIRAQPKQRDLIDYAAHLQGKSRSEFMIEAACQKAQEMLLDRRFFGLDEQQFQEFAALLDAAPVTNEKLDNLLTFKSPWK